MVDEERLVMEDRQRQILIQGGTLDEKGSRSKKAARRKLMLGSLLCVAVLCAGSGKGVRRSRPDADSHNTGNNDAGCPILLPVF